MDFFAVCLEGGYFYAGAAPTTDPTRARRFDLEVDFGELKALLASIPRSKLIQVQVRYEIVPIADFDRDGSYEEG